MNFRLRIWRQKDRQSRGKLLVYEARDISPNTSFLEMLDIVNENLLARGFCAGSELNSNSKARCRSFHGRRGMHRLRRVRGSVPKRVGHALHRSESLASVPYAPGKSRTRDARSKNGAGDGCGRFWQ